MAFLMHLSFDNRRRLQRNSYLFEYKGVRFKLVQNNPRRWPDHLLTIVPKAGSPDSDVAFSVASEFLSALAWESGGPVAVWDSGGCGWPEGRSLRRARPRIFSLSRIAFPGNIGGYGLTQIPHVKTQEQRIALALFREARASNNDYLSFLFFWQVLDVGGGKPEAFVDEVFGDPHHHLKVNRSDIDSLPLGDRKLGRYLCDDCRDAIAHIRRFPGRRKLDLDKAEERCRLATSVRVVEGFAEYYIRNALCLSDKLHLLRPRGGGFPRFVNPSTALPWEFVLAYPPAPPTLPRGPRPASRKRRQG